MEFESFDARMAQGLVKAHEQAGGLPGYLGIRLTDVSPGGMRAEIPIRDELLTPFGNLHGGVLAALCDHVLGTVCYPVMPRGAWAATTCPDLVKNLAGETVTVDDLVRSVADAAGIAGAA